MQEGSKVKVYVNVLPSHRTNQTSNVAFHSGLQINVLPTGRVIEMGNAMRGL